MARKADTYRGARRNALRGERRSLTLKEERKGRGITRSQFDAERERERGVDL